MTDTRIERDPLGEKAVPASALYGIQTLRAAENFPISGLRPLPAFVDAMVWIKRSAALTHRETGRLEARLADAIVRAADEVLTGQHRDQFIVDVYQAGAQSSCEAVGATGFSLTITDANNELYADDTYPFNQYEGTTAGLPAPASVEAVGRAMQARAARD